MSLKLINRKKEKGFIGMSFGVALESVTLWRIGPFRQVLHRDIDHKCRTLFAYMEWWPRIN